MPYYMKKGQVWRFICALFLNYGLSTMLLNIVVEMIVGFMLEGNMGSMRMMAFFMISGIGGTLFATVNSPLYSAGPEPAMFGMAAGLLGWFMFYWQSFEDRCSFGQRLCYFILLVLVVVMMVFLMYSQA